SPELTLILGALEADDLVRHHGARWHWSKGPLLPAEGAAADPTSENAFGYVVHPFAAVGALARQAVQRKRQERARATRAAAPGPLPRRAEGRTLVLTNDPAAGRTVLAELTDPALAQGVALLEQGKPEQAGELFQKLLKDARHERNLYLV